MATLRALLDDVVEGAETVVLFSPSAAYYERSLDVEDVTWWCVRPRTVSARSGS